VAADEFTVDFFARRAGCVPFAALAAGEGFPVPATDRFFVVLLAAWWAWLVRLCGFFAEVVFLLAVAGWSKWSGLTSNCANAGAADSRKYANKAA
jgi:hypothetical protein